MPIFGSTVTSAFTDPTFNEVPAFLDKALTQLEENWKGLKTEWLFYQDGDPDTVESIKNGIENKGAKFSYSPSHTSHDLSTVVKNYFQDLDEPAFPFQLYSRFVTCNLKVEDMREVVKELPTPNLVIVQRLFLFFKKLSSFANVNMMTAYNISCTVANDLLRFNPPNPDDYNHIADTISFMIENAPSIFPSNGDAPKTTRHETPKEEPTEQEQWERLLQEKNMLDQQAREDQEASEDKEKEEKGPKESEAPPVPKKPPKPLPKKPAGLPPPPPSPTESSLPAPPSPSPVSPPISLDSVPSDPVSPSPATSAPTTPSPASSDTPASTPVSPSPAPTAPLSPTVPPKPSSTPAPPPKPTSVVSPTIPPKPTSALVSPSPPPKPTSVAPSVPPKPASVAPSSPPPTHTPAQNPVQTPAQTPVQTPVQTPAQTTVQAPVQTPAQTPVQTQAQTPSHPPQVSPQVAQVTQPAQSASPRLSMRVPPQPPTASAPAPASATASAPAHVPATAATPAHSSAIASAPAALSTSPAHAHASHMSVRVPPQPPINAAPYPTMPSEPSQSSIDPSLMQQSRNPYGALQPQPPRPQQLRPQGPQIRASPMMQEQALAQHAQHAQTQARNSQWRYEGYLVKKGAKVRNWKTRWFRMDSSVIYYYKDRNSKTPLGNIVLAAVKNVFAIPAADTAKGYAFDVHTDVRNWSFVAYSAEEREKWIDALTRTSPALAEKAQPLQVQQILPPQQNPQIPQQHAQTPQYTSPPHMPQYPSNPQLSQQQNALQNPPQNSAQNSAQNPQYYELLQQQALIEQRLQQMQVQGNVPPTPTSPTMQPRKPLPAVVKPSPQS